ncbi:MAG: group I intron-associated PD-(D/E)XK endonuclease [Gaiellaceae bacterium]
MGSRLLRVQCKWAPRIRDVVLVRCRSCRRTRDGLQYRGYTAAEIDMIAAYCPDLDRSYLISADSFDGRVQLYLRLSPSRNNQRSGVNWADDFVLEAKLRDLLGP